ncbi:MAG TPA: MBL fold metallo-hydrolase [Candidatus Lokiarchaeia archaeon]|nr:MBL fold metallo-hydrolase [Candidatus Lokiarchaeia archaeon]
MKISDVLYSYPDPKRLWPRGNGCAVHILKGSEKIIMVDTGVNNAGFPGRLIKKMAVDGLALKDVNEIWITHPHIDHVNGIPFVQAASEASVYVHPGGAAYLKDPTYTVQALLEAAGDDKSFLLNVSPRMLLFGVKFMCGPGPVVEPAALFADGEVRDIGFPVEIKFAPGHMPEGVAFFVPSEKILFTGDAFDISRETRPTLNTPVADWADLHATLEWMLSKDAEILANGHHWVVTGRDACRHELETSLGFLDKIRTATLEVLARGPAGIKNFLRQYNLKDQEQGGFEANVTYWCTMKSLVREGVVERCPEIKNGKIKRLLWRLA